MFIKRLVDLYNTLASRSLYLPYIFKELNLYQHDKHYNNFYYTGHHKKELLKREKLEQLAESLELSINQPWASEIKWTDFILETFELTNMVKRYAKYLQRVNNEINAHHVSNSPVRTLNQDLQVYTIEGSLETDDKYQELSDFLFDKNNYEFFDLDEEYVPSNPMQKYCYINESYYLSVSSGQLSWQLDS